MKNQETTVALESLFIESLIDKGVNVTVFLVSGIKLGGTITDSGDNALILTRDGVSQLVMKRAVATIMPQDAEGNR